MKTLFHPASERGYADHGWLHAHHSFSFANWYDPAKVHFGMLRVLNDDIVEPGEGFGMHPHNDMEIVTVILEGALEHRDNMGNGSVIRKGDVQVMSAGTGVMHSEFNPSSTEAVNLFQLWIFPRAKHLQPRYDQKTFPPAGHDSAFRAVASGLGTPGALTIHQDAEVSLATLANGRPETYTLRRPGNGAYILVISGEAEIAGQRLGRRDAIGVWETAEAVIGPHADTELLIVEVPMN
jgi:redox-sensitive bicupin YhaK (pirin superfamily)